jgi:hypothetical protein
MDLDDIADLCELTLGDPTNVIYPRPTLKSWVLEACRDYSSHFQQIATVDLHTAIGIHQYDLPTDCIHIVSVEYPPSLTPPHVLALFDHLLPEFWLSDGYYDWQARFAQATAPKLWISATPTANNVHIAVTYLAGYYADAMIQTENVLVPDHHMPLLVLFVQWKATVERLHTTLNQDPTAYAALANELATAIQVARETYDFAIRAAKSATSQTKFSRPWRMDLTDPIY